MNKEVVNPDALAKAAALREEADNLLRQVKAIEEKRRQVASDAMLTITHGRLILVSDGTGPGTYLQDVDSGRRFDCICRASVELHYEQTEFVSVALVIEPYALDISGEVFATQEEFENGKRPRRARLETTPEEELEVITPYECTVTAEDGSLVNDVTAMRWEIPVGKPETPEEVKAGFRLTLVPESGLF